MLNGYKRYLNKLPFAVFICNNKFKVLYKNEAFKNLFEADDKHDLIGKAISCIQDSVSCGKGEECKYCPLRKALEEARSGSLPSTSKQIIKKIEIHGKKKTLSFNMTVKRVGRNFLALIENSLEMDLYNELMAARNLQQQMLPPPGMVDGKKFSYFYRPSGEVGGDLLDVYKTNDLVCGFVADISGRGLGAAMLSSFIKTAYERTKPLLSQTLIEINKKFKELKTDELGYITMLAVAIDRKQNKFHYTLAGHSVPLLIKASGKVRELTVNSPPISTWFDFYNYKDLSHSFSSGDILALFTDGVTETKNTNGQRFGLKRVKDILSQSESASDFTARLEKQTAEFAGQAPDDMTALAFDL